MDGDAAQREEETSRFLQRFKWKARPLASVSLSLSLCGVLMKKPSCFIAFERGREPIENPVCGSPLGMRGRLELSNHSNGVEFRAHPGAQRAGHGARSVVRAHAFAPVRVQTLRADTYHYLSWNEA